MHGCAMLRHAVCHVLNDSIQSLNELVHGKYINTSTVIIQPSPAVYTTVNRLLYGITIPTQCKIATTAHSGMLRLSHVHRTIKLESANVGAWPTRTACLAVKIRCG